MTTKPIRRRAHAKLAQAPRLLPLSARGKLRRLALLSGMGCTIVALSLDPHVVRADGPAFGSPAWAASRMPAGSNSGAPPVAAAGGNLAAGFTGTLTPDAAAQRATRSVADLSAAAQKLATALAAQASAAQAARAGTQINVPDGLATGGLVPDSGLSANGVANPVPSWVNLDAPVQRREGAATLVTVEQTDAKAIANWQSFNVGANTKLHFDQHRGTQTDGSNNWIVFNRITDPTLSASRILGQISAEGSVYLINNNGFIFGAGSVVNTHSLLASTLNLFSSDRGVGNSVFLSSQGIAQFTAPPEGLNTSGTRPILLDPGTAAGNISVEAGATISTEPLGYTLLAAPNVANAGLIRADEGQAMLVAARNVALAPSPVNSTVASAQIKPYAFSPNGIPSPTQVVNSGVIEAERGSVTLVGLDNQQNGVVAVTTDITHPGTVVLTDGVLVDGSAGTGGGRVLFGEGSLTAVMPDAGLATTPASSVASFVTGSITVAAGSATFGRSSQVEAPGANLVLGLANGGTANPYGINGRAFVDVDAIIDLAGLADVLPPAGGGPLVTIPRIGQNELADSPVQRDGFLFKLTDVVIDATVTGTRSDGTSWIGSPILNAAGYANQIPQTIAELLTRGGSFSLKSNGGEFISAAGSLINLDGGYVRYGAGQNLGTTRLVTDDGHLYSIAKADPLYTYAGLAGSVTFAQSRFGISDTWVDPIVSGRAGSPLAESIVGGKAGALLLGEAGTAGVEGSRKGLSEVLIAGELSAHAFAGRAQVLAGKLPEGGSLSITSDNALRIEDHAVSLEAIADGFGATTPVVVSGSSAQDERNVQIWNPLDGTALSAAGFGRVVLDAAQVHVASGGLTVQQGGTISLSGGRVVVDADLVATSGRIALTSGTQATTGISFIDPASTERPASGDLLINSGATLSTAGRFVNDYGLGADQQQGSGALNGGSIVLSSNSATAAQLVSGSRSAGGNPVFGTSYDTTGAIVLASGSRLDVSGGGYVRPDGSVLSANGLALGSGGNVSILSYPILSAEATPGRSNPATNASAGTVQLDGQILGYGFSGGGSFALRALNLAIGADPARAGDLSVLTLPTTFFADQGFANYQLSTPWDATIASGATVQVSHRNFVADPGALRALATGSDLYASAATPLGFLDDYHRAPTNLSIAAGDYLSNPALPPQNPLVSNSLTLGEGAAILADAGAAIRLGAFNQVTVLGSIVAHGGSISLSGDTAVGSTANGGYAPPPTPARGGGTTTSTAKSVWLGADSLLDVSGIALVDPLAAASGHDGQLASQPVTGRVLNGGSITLSNDSGYVVAERGAQLEASGASASFDLIAATGSAQPGQGYATTPTAVWSDGGTITLAAGGGLLFDGSLHAAGGAAEARGGSLKIVGLNNGGGPVTRNGQVIGTTQVQATAVVLRQDGAFVPNGLRPGDDIESGSAFGAPSGTLYFAVDRITHAVDRASGATIASGIANLLIGADPSAQLLAPQNGSAPLTLDFSGPIKLSLPGSIALNVAQLRARQADNLVYGPDDPASIGAPAISISGGYVVLAGNSYGGRTPLDLAAHVNDATLALTGTHGLDIAGTVALQNFASSSFSTTGDLRLVTAAAANLDSTGLAASSGLLYSPGDLAFSAARLYPASGQSFAIVAANPSADTRITFARAPGSNSESTPLSAGGRLLVDATSIDQGGALYAPYGTLQLGIAASGPVAPSAADPAYSKLPFDAAALNLVGTQTLKLAAGGLSSVSGGSLTIPYGTTVDGQSLQYDVVHDAQLPASAVVAAAPPAKRLALGAASITLAKGATVDLSGGSGSLQAQEFVPGTGGTRDVLATTGNNSSALFPDGRAVYAIIPGQNAASGAYDPAFDSSGAGPLVGRSVHLSGIAGLADGDYVLLPARYATLPGAYRVVESGANSDALAARNLVLPDGSYLSAGYFVDAVTGARDARSSSFLVQSDAVWQQYSQYTLTSAAAYYTAQATKQGTALPQLPLDAGQLSLAALSSLKFGATVNSAGGTLLKDDGTVQAQGSGAQVDIAARDIQVLGANSTALAGYVQVAASDLESLDAGSLLLGGTRRSTADGIAIDTVATSVVVGDGGTTGRGAASLGGPELLLATHADATDTRALSQGVLLGAGSALDATGAAQSRAQAIEVAGDGTLLRLSASGPVTVTRSGASSNGGGAVLSLGKGASIDGLADAANPAALTLDSSGDIKLADGASFRARAIDLGAASASFVSASVDSDGIGGLVLAPELVAQLASAEQLSIRARDGIRFVNAVLLDAAGQPLKDADGQPRYEAIDIALQGAVSLSAPQITAGAGAVALSVAAITDSSGKTTQPGLLRFAGGNGTAATAGSGSLSLSADQLEFGDGGATFSGLESFTATARERVLGSGTAPVAFGAADVGFRTPLLTVATAANLSLTTSGALTLAGTGAAGGIAAGSSAGLGGHIALSAEDLALSTAVVAHAGLIEVEASGVKTLRDGASTPTDFVHHELALGAGALLDVSGVALQYFDVTLHAPGGAIRLNAADQLGIDATSRFAFGAAAGGGDAGSLSLAALSDTRTLASFGTLSGAATAGGQGGSLALDLGGGADLNALADALHGAGVTQSLALHTRAGNLALASGRTITASEIALTADADGQALGASDGNISIAGTLDASGAKGGRIALSGASGVELSGRLLARGSSASERGGTVRIATGDRGDPTQTGGTYGNETIAAAQSGEIRIDGSALIDVSGGTAGGLSGGSIAFRAPLLSDGGLKLGVDRSASLLGSRETSVEAYAIWDAASGSGFNGNIDPAGNAAFFGNTLGGFVSQGAFAFEAGLAGIDHLVVRPGIELRNSAGDINVSSNWNLGAVNLDGNGQVASHVYRHGDVAPVVTLRASGNVTVNASISDGFVQYANPLGLQAPNPSSLARVQALYAVLRSAYPQLTDSGSRHYIAPPATFASGADAGEVAQYYGLYEQYLDYLLYAKLPLGALAARPNVTQAPATRIETQGIAVLPIGAPVATNNPQGYASYLVQYEAYLEKRENAQLITKVALPAPPPARLVPVFTSAAIGGPVDNSISPQATAGNPLPLASATLAGGDSASLRIVAGAATASADPLAVVAASGSDVVLGGGSNYSDALTGNAVYTPTMIRSGSGAISVAAARDVSLADPTTPGVIYTAGVPAAGRSAGQQSGLLQTALYIGGQSDPVSASPSGEYLVTGVVQPEGAGDLAISAGRDLIGAQSAFSTSGNAGQAWWQWLQTGNEATYSLDSQHKGGNGLVAGGITGISASSINYGAFGQGLLSAGGDVRLSAGNDIRDLSVSLPSTWYFSSDADGRTVVNTVGGGDLSVHAGGDILSGSYFVARGSGRIAAGGDIAPDLQFQSSDVATLLAVQDGSLAVTARGKVAIGGVYDPSYLPAGLPSPLFSAESTPYSARSSVAVTAVSGAFRFGTLGLANRDEQGYFGTGLALGSGGSLQYSAAILPASLSLEALGADLAIERSGELYPSAVGNLGLYANGSILLASTASLRSILEDNPDVLANGQDRYFGMIDADPALLPSQLNQPDARQLADLPPALQRSYRYISARPNAVLHARHALHADDHEASRVYALHGDLVSGVVGDDGVLRDALVLAPDEQARIKAGRDIVNLSFLGQQVHDADLTVIAAGRDLYDTPGGTPQTIALLGSEPSLQIGGPGALLVEAGRDIGPLANQNQVVLARQAALASDPPTLDNLGSAPVTGIVAIGNNANPYLPRRSADLNLLFGIGPGVAQDAFIAKYLNPAIGAVGGLPSYVPELVAFVRRQQAGQAVDTGFVVDQAPPPPALSPATAYAAFRAMPEDQQRLLVAQVFSEILTRVGSDAARSGSSTFGNYGPGYEAIATLFPDAFGYSRNRSQAEVLTPTGQRRIGPDGEIIPWGSENPIATGNLDLRGTTIQTQQGGPICSGAAEACTKGAALGGNITLLGPGGNALIGSTAAPSVLRDANGNIFAGPGTQGLLALQEGGIRVFTDRSLLLAQSRVFTEGGGDLSIWSSNGDINAGRGARTTADTPAPTYLCDTDDYCRVDARGAVTGAGIATLQIDPRAKSGNVYLIAPAGTVDAGDAGIRVSGNLVIAAAAVANADNVQVQGSAIGLHATVVDSGTLAAGSSAAAAAQSQAQSLAARPVDRASTVIMVEVYGFGAPDEEQKKKLLRQ